MKINLHHIFFVLCFTILTPGGILSLQAQDASYPIPDSYDMEFEKERDRGVYSAGEFDPLLNNKNQVIRDSIMARPTYNRSSRSQLDESANTAKNSAEDDDSILSFNFLYYLVEKYKMQDIVD
jgi:hypothetical protein